MKGNVMHGIDPQAFGVSLLFGILVVLTGILLVLNARLEKRKP